jgi:nitrogen fixation regulatory protein
MLQQQTDKKLPSLQSFKLAADYTVDHIVITDPDGLIVYANRAMTRITGYEVEEVMGKKAGSSQLWGGFLSLAEYARLWGTIKTNKERYTGILPNRRKNGERYQAEVQILPVLDEQGEVEFFIGIEREIL